MVGRELLFGLGDVAHHLLVWSRTDTQRHLKSSSDFFPADGFFSAAAGKPPSRPCSLAPEVTRALVLWEHFLESLQPVRSNCSPETKISAGSLMKHEAPQLVVEFSLPDGDDAGCLTAAPWRC